jgi:hypothetical protein
MRKVHALVGILSNVALVLLVGCGSESGVFESQTAIGQVESDPTSSDSSPSRQQEAQRIGIAPDAPDGLFTRPANVDVSKFDLPRTTGWTEINTLPSVTTAYSFALGVNDTDNSARLGFMFTDATYRASLISQGVLWDGGNSYSGANAIAIYNLQGTGASATWTPYQGRVTPQTYSYSELVYDSGSSFYTTNYNAFGGLISVIKDGGKGVWALTPAYTGSRAHSVAFNNHVLYALAAQSGVGLTLSTTPISSFGNLNNLWTNLATIETTAANATLPKLIDAGGALVGAYIVSGNAKVRATASPSTVTTASAFTDIGGCTGATKVDVAYANSLLYVGCVSSTGVLTVKSANISNPSSVTWSTITTGVSGAVSDIDLSGLGTSISLAVRQGTSVRVFTSVTDTTPSYDEVIAGQFDLVNSSQGLVLSVCDLAGTTKQVRTFVH